MDMSKKIKKTSLLLSKLTSVALTFCMAIIAFSAVTLNSVSAADTTLLTPEVFDFEYAQAGTDVSESSFSVAADPTDYANKVLKLDGTDDNAPVSGKINAVFLTSDGNGKYFLESGTYYAFSMDVYVPSDSGKDKFSMALQGLDGTKTALSYNTSPFNQSANTFFQLSYNSASEIRQQKITEWSAKTEIDGIKKGAWISISGYFNTSNNLGANTALALNINCDDFTAFSPCFDNIEIYRLDKNKASILINTRNKSGDVVVLEGEEGETVDPADYISNSGYDFSGCYNYKKTDLVYGGGSWGQTGELDLSDANRFSGVFPGAGVYMVCADWVKNAALEPDAVFGFSYPAADADIAESSFSVVTDPANADNKVLQLNGTDEKAPVSGKTNAIYLTTDGTAGSIYRLMPGNKFYAFSVDIYLPEGGADDFSLAFNALNTSKTALSYNANAFSSYNTADYQLIYNSAENVQQQKITNWGGRVEFSGFRTGKWVTVAGYFKTTNSFSEGSGIALSVDSADMADFKPYFDNIKIYALDTSKTNLIIKTGNAAGDVLVLQGTEGQEMNAGDYLINEGYNLLGCYNYAKTNLSGSWAQTGELDLSDANRFSGIFPAAGVHMLCADWLSDLAAQTTVIDFENYPDIGDSETSALYKEAKAEKCYLYARNGEASLGFNVSKSAGNYADNIAYLSDGNEIYTVEPGTSYIFDFYWYEDSESKSEQFYIKFAGLDGKTSPDNLTGALNLFTVRPAIYDTVDDSRAEYGVNGASNQINIIYPRLTQETARGKWNRCIGYFTVPAGSTNNCLGISVVAGDASTGKIYIDDFSITRLNPSESTVIFATQNADRDVFVFNGKPGALMSFPAIDALENKDITPKYYTFAETGSVNNRSEKTEFGTDRFPSVAGARVVIAAKSDLTGDANGDWAVNITDLVRIKKYAAQTKNANVIFDNANLSKREDGIDPYNITGFDLAALNKLLLGV